nr:MAG TPA: hypothetical protein [Caudoviricetes sp.]
MYRTYSIPPIYFSYNYISSCKIIQYLIIKHPTMSVDYYAIRLIKCVLIVCFDMS